MEIASTLPSAHHYSTYACCCSVAKLYPILCDPARLLSVGFSGQGYWSGLPIPSPGDLPDPGIKSQYPASAGKRFTAEPPAKLSGDAPGINSLHLQSKLISQNNVSSYTLGNEGEVSKPFSKEPNTFKSCLRGHNWSIQPAHMCKKPLCPRPRCGKPVVPGRLLYSCRSGWGMSSDKHVVSLQAEGRGGLGSELAPRAPAESDTQHFCLRVIFHSESRGHS